MSVVQPSNSPTTNPQAPYPVAYRSKRRGLNPWFIRLPILALVGAFLWVILLVAFVMALQVHYDGRIYPGVTVLGSNMGGLSAPEAASVLAETHRIGEDAVYTFRYGDQFWQMTAGELGVAFDAEATIAQAIQVGHTSNPINRFNQQTRAWFNGESVAPVITYDQTIAIERLNAIAEQINQAPVNPTLMLTGTTVQTTPGQAGRALDTMATLEQLEAHILDFTTGAEIPLVVNETAAAISNVDEAANKIQVALSGPLHLVATGENGAQLGPWTANVEQIAALLRVDLVEQPNNAHRYEVRIDMSAFEQFLQTLAPGLMASPRDGRFHFDDVTRELTVMQPAVSGRTLNIPQTLARLQESVFNADSRIVPMAFDLTLPRYHNRITAAELGIRELVAESTTFFEGSTSNRRHNIALSASRFDGLIVAPGEEFSFNYWLGEISTEAGFVEGQVIFGGRTVTGIGGGVCQVSTTIFRAAFEGGFAITERNSHGYRVGYYELRGSPPGLDAAIWQPVRDFRFQNNTPYHLLIETSFLPGDNALQFRFYSTQHWRTELEEAIVKNIVPAPEVRYEMNRELQPGQVVQVDYSADGADVTIYRNIYDMQGNLVREDYAYTHYVPWQAVYQVAPGDSRLRTG